MSNCNDTNQPVIRQACMGFGTVMQPPACTPPKSAAPALKAPTPSNG